MITFNSNWYTIFFLIVISSYIFDFSLSSLIYSGSLFIDKFDTDFIKGMKSVFSKIKLALTVDIFGSVNVPLFNIVSLYKFNSMNSSKNLQW